MQRSFEVSPGCMLSAPLTPLEIFLPTSFIGTEVKLQEICKENSWRRILNKGT